MNYSLAVNQEESIEVDEVNFVVGCSKLKSIVAARFSLTIIWLIVLQGSLQITNTIFLAEIMLTIDQIAHNRRTKTEAYLVKFLHSFSEFFWRGKYRLFKLQITKHFRELVTLVQLNHGLQWLFGCMDETQVYFISVYSTLEKRLRRNL